MLTMFSLSFRRNEKEKEKRNKTKEASIITKNSKKKIRTKEERKNLKKEGRGMGERTVSWKSIRRT